MKIIKEKTICLTGHRPKSLPWGYDENNQVCINFKQELEKIFIGAIKYGIDTFLSGMAEGFDMISTEILIKLRNNYNIKVIAIVPCLGQELKWKPSQQTRYNELLTKCDDVYILSNHYTPSCMNIRNKFMVEHSSICIACWNGKPSGTGNTIKFAKENGNRIRIINPNNF